MHCAKLLLTDEFFHFIMQLLHLSAVVISHGFIGPQCHLNTSAAKILLRVL